MPQLRIWRSFVTPNAQVSTPPHHYGVAHAMQIKFSLSLLLASAVFTSACSPSAPPSSHMASAEQPAVAASTALAESAVDFYVGHWTPLSNALIVMGPLEISTDGYVRWHECAAPYVAEPNPPEPGIRLVLSVGSQCRLNDLVHTRVQVLRVEKPAVGCDLKMSAYASRHDVDQHQPAATGLYTREPCTTASNH